MIKPDVVIYHGGCADGFGAAWAINRKFPEGVSYYPGVHGKEPPLGVMVEDLNVAVVDFSYKHTAMKELCFMAKSILVLDHHKSAEAELDGLEAWAKDNGYDAEVHFDMERSGAAMAWEHFHPYQTMPALIKMIQDCDLWRFWNPESKAFITALRTIPQTFVDWDWAARHTDNLVLDGTAMLTYHLAICEQLVEQAYWAAVTKEGSEIPVVNCSYAFGSDVANMLLKKYPTAPYAAYWFKDKDGVVQWGLRSEDSRLDVSEIARAMGGGGHRNASGFR